MKRSKQRKGRERGGKDGTGKEGKAEEGSEAYKDAEEDCCSERWVVAVVFPC